MKRVVIPELLDSDSGTPAEIAASLTDLRHINQWFGGIGSTQALLEEVAAKTGSKSIQVLDVAAGTGYAPRSAGARMQKRGIELDVTLLDRAASHLRDGCCPAAKAVAGDVLALPFADASFDVVSSCLFIHHLSPEELVQSVNEGLRVGRAAVVINDVVRHPVHLLLVYAGLPLFRSRLTHHDAVASVRQAYTVEEMNEMLQRTQASRFEIRRYPLFRMGVIAWKK